MSVSTQQSPICIAVGGTHKAVSNVDLNNIGWKKPKKSTGDNVRRTVTHLLPDTWLDTDTGEIITKKTDARANGIQFFQPTHVRMLNTQARIRECAPKERKFVIYVLRMRNRRGGLVIDLRSILDLWIRHAHANLRKKDIARKRKQLENILYTRRIMVNSQTLATDLQIHTNPNPQEIIEEASIVYKVLPIPAIPGTGFLNREVKVLDWCIDREIAAGNASRWTPNDRLRHNTAIHGTMGRDAANDSTSTHVA